jgi:hypothetical protein
MASWKNRVGQQCHLWFKEKIQKYAIQIQTIQPLMYIAKKKAELFRSICFHFSYLDKIFEISLAVCQK